MSRFKKVNKKKGITLIEVIISVALIAILLIPLTNLVMTSIKKNKKAENKQEATNLGQKIVEELKAQDSIQLHDFNSTTNKGKYTTLDGFEMTVEKVSDPDPSVEKWKMEGKGNHGLTIEANFVKNNKVKYNNNKAEVDNLIDSKYAVVIDFTGSSIKWATTFDADKAEYKSGNNISISGYNMVKLNIEKDSTDKIEDIKLEVGNIQFKPTGEVDKIETKNSITINGVTSGATRIKVIREKDYGTSELLTELLTYVRSELPIDIDYIDRGDDTTRDIDIRLDYSDGIYTGEASNVRLRQNVSESEIDTLKSLYDIDINIKKETDVLYSGKISVNTDITA